MSTLKVNALNNGGSAIDFPSSFTLGGNPIEQGYTSSATEPTSPNTGDLWWDSTNEALYQYLNGEFKAITTVGAWRIIDISQFSYDNVSASVAPSTEGNPQGLHVTEDGSMLFMCGLANDRIVQYSFTTDGDLSTLIASLDQNFIVTELWNPKSMHFDESGEHLILANTSNKLRYYPLSTGFDFDTVGTLTEVTLSSTASTSGGAISNISSIQWLDKGYRISLADETSDSLYVFALSTAYDISTMGSAYESAVTTASLSAGTNPQGLRFDERGYTAVFIDNAENLHQIDMTSKYDLSTASLSSNTFTVTQDVSMRDICFFNRGTKFFAVGSGSDKFYSYSTNGGAE